MVHIPLSKDALLRARLALVYEYTRYAGMIRDLRDSGGPDKEVQVLLSLQGDVIETLDELNQFALNQLAGA